MKRTACALLFFGLYVHLPAYGDGLPVTPGFLGVERDDALRRAMQKQIQLDRLASPDDYLIAVGRAGDFNILADVTDVPATAPADPPDPIPASSLAPGKNRLSIGHFVSYDLMGRHKLIREHLDERTMLFWLSPDVSQIAQAIRARHAAAPRNDPAPLDAKQASTLLTEYFQRVHKWDGKWENVDISVPVDDLPPELRAHVEAEIYREEISKTAHGQSGLGASQPGSAWWKKTRLVVAPRTRRPTEPIGPFLTTPEERVRGGRTFGVPIGRLNFLARR